MPIYASLPGLAEPYTASLGSGSRGGAVSQAASPFGGGRVRLGHLQSRLAGAFQPAGGFLCRVQNISVDPLATGLMALTPERGWIFLTIMRFIVGLGVGGFFAVDMRLLQEFVPASKARLDQRCVDEPHFRTPGSNHHGNLGE